MFVVTNRDHPGLIIQIVSIQLLPPAAIALSIVFLNQIPLIGLLKAFLIFSTLSVAYARAFPVPQYRGLLA